MYKGKVGSKGELFPPKEIREQINLKAGQTITYRIVNGRLIVERILTPEEILEKPSKAIISLEEIKKNRLNLSEDSSQ
jgi:bifunctional DNA-binding transcriptional regulator/antitoxin component of YhaV-PrlF toxin-antitoxin module